MARKINIIGKQPERIQDTGRSVRRINPDDVAAALGAEPCGQRLPRGLDPLCIAEIGNELLKRLHSTGGRPALRDATKSWKVPLSAADVAALEEIVTAIERSTGVRPSLGQIASAIVRHHVTALQER